MGRPRGDISERVLAAAEERFLHDGVDGASMREIARAAKTSVGMVTYYFPTKNELFSAVVERVYGPFLTAVATALAPDAPFETRVERLYLRVGAMSEQEFRVVRMVLREALVASPRMPALLGRFSHGHIPMVLGLLAEGVATGRVRGDLPALVTVASTLALGIFPQLARRLIGPHVPAFAEMPAAEKMAKVAVGVLMEGIGAGEFLSSPPRR